MLLLRGAQLVRCCVFWPVHLVVTRLISSQNTEAAYGSFLTARDIKHYSELAKIKSMVIAMPINSKTGAFVSQSSILG